MGCCEACQRGARHKAIHGGSAPFQPPRMAVCRSDKHSATRCQRSSSPNLAFDVPAPSCLAPAYKCSVTLIRVKVPNR
jgi:hypothetical protein